MQEVRVRKRMPCEVTVDGRRHSGLVLNVSPRGLFVQTNAEVSRGAAVQIDLREPARPDPINVSARVVWRRVVPPKLMTVQRGGFGLRIENASEAYYEFLSGVLPGTTPRAVEAPDPARSPSPSPAPARPRARQPAPRSAPSERRFRVRVKQVGGNRSRTIFLSCASEQEARERALASLGEGWTILELARSG